MTIKITDDCISCGQCIEFCEQGAIEIKSTHGYGQAVIKKEKCIKCGLCLVFDCPGDAIVCVNEVKP
jgi:ferredoxin